MYRSFGQWKPFEEKSGHPKRDEDDASDNNPGYDTREDDVSEDKFNFVMTHQTKSKKDYKKVDESKKDYKCSS